MALFTASLNSGSNGNCYYVGNESEAILVDAGLSCRETEKRMRKLDLDIHRVKAIFISHEHGDHIRGLPTLAHKYSIPVYITPTTARYGPHLIGHLSVQFRDGEPVEIGSLTIHPFSKAHDAADPHSFVISSNGVHVGVFTDIGKVCDNLVYYFSQCHAAYLETNYDEYMLENGKYPLHLKNRIRNGEGHLSNRQALELFLAHRPPHQTHLFLAHLSEQNNHPDKALEAFALYQKDMHISVASRYEASGLYHIRSNNTYPLRPKPSYLGRQMNLFH